MDTSKARQRQRGGPLDNDKIRLIVAQAIKEYGEAQFACGEWDDDSDVSCDAVIKRVAQARLNLESLLGINLP